MNKRMKKKTLRYKALTYKERVKNQQITLHKLFMQINQLKKENAEHIKGIKLLDDYLDVKEEIIKQRETSLSIMSIESAKKIHELEELVELHKKDAIAANQAYEDKDKQLREMEFKCNHLEALLADATNAEEYWRKRYSEYVNKSWWKKVLNIG